uniref:Uncharacterized protein n=1 Tax=Strigamia maritima TaxID=126957 RepID=T1IHR2_STRMM
QFTLHNRFVNLVNHHRKANHLDQNEENISIPSNIDPESSTNQNTKIYRMQITKESTKTLIPVLHPQKSSSLPKPKWHPPWKLFRVISGHLGAQPNGGAGQPVVRHGIGRSSHKDLGFSERAVYSLPLHTTIDVLITCGRDSTARVWDMRSKANVHTLSGHTNTVLQVVCQSSEPQIITGSHDCTIRLWDLA